MNKKQKIIVTIYMIVAVLSFCYTIYSYLTVAAGGWVIMDGHEVALNSVPNGYTNAFWGVIMFYVIGLIILGIPTYITYKVWGDKKAKGN